MSHTELRASDRGEIIDPNGLNLFRLTMMVITASICGGIFSLAGDMAAGGASTGAVLISWAICFVGVFSLMMCFYGLSQIRPDLTGGIYAYAAAGFGDYVGFNSAWGYWISACLSNVSFAILLFSALGYFFHPFEGGNNLLSCICASVFLWVLVLLVARGVKEATGINVVVTIAKLIPLALFVVSIILLGKFNPDIFFANFWGEPGGPDLSTQIISTMIALVWVFTGIEGAVVISGRAKYAKDVGRVTAIGFIAVFVLYFIISLESMGIMSRAEMAALPTPSMAGILECAIGPIGASIVNLGVVLSLLGAMLGYVIIAAETPFEAARQERRSHCHRAHFGGHRSAVPDCVGVFREHLPVLLRLRRLDDSDSLRMLGGLLHEDRVEARGGARRSGGQGASVRHRRLRLHGVPRVGGRSGGRYHHHHPVRAGHHRVRRRPARAWRAVLALPSR